MKENSQEEARGGGGGPGPPGSIPMYPKMRGISERLYPERRAPPGLAGNGRGDSQGHDPSSQNSGSWGANVHLRRNTGSPQVMEVTDLPGIDEEFHQARMEKDMSAASPACGALLWG